MPHADDEARAEDVKAEVLRRLGWEKGHEVVQLNTGVREKISAIVDTAVSGGLPAGAGRARELLQGKLLEDTIEVLQEEMWA